ncbi:MAG: EF-hand domain-containing protein [Planctomycetes bacterium]|nr:EF-hand domain-containing protein [Planctomycetota bacterium]
MKLTGPLAALIAGLALTGAAMAQNDEKTDDLFKTLDANSDGKLTAGEVSEDQKRFFDRLLRVGDSDKNGELTRAEFEKATSRNADETAPSPSDRRPAAGQPGNRPGQRGADRARNPEEMFKRMDRNKDGKLTLDEIPEPFRNRMKPLFERVGKDAITVEDLKKLGGRPTDRRPGTNSNRPEGRRPGDAPRPDQPNRPGDNQRRGAGPAFFRELDQNKDGALSKAELERAAMLLGKLDRNGNEKLELSELFGFGDGGPGRPRPDGAGRPGDRPQRPDDQPGTTDRPRRPGETPSRRPENSQPEGRPENRPGAGGNSQARLQENFKRIDKNNDGFLSRDEAPEKLKENFDRVDKNSDGKISVDEIRALYDRSRRD